MKLRLLHLWPAAAVLLADQLTKALAARLLPPHEPLKILPGLFSLTLVHNTGVAFGLGAGRVSALRGLLLALLSLAAIALLLRYASQAPPGRRGLQLALGLIIGGALGNIADRLRLGYVVDFLDFHWRAFAWPTFNLADTCISVGMGLLLLDLFLSRPRRAETLAG
jgi:signal peptidase II